MGTVEFDTSEFDDPAPNPLGLLKPIPQGSPVNDESSEDHPEIPQPPPGNARKRKLPYRADVALEGKRYDGRRVSRREADLDVETLGLLSDEENDPAQDEGSDLDSVAADEDESRSLDSDEVDKDGVEDGDDEGLELVGDDDDDSMEHVKGNRRVNAAQRLKAEERAVAARLAEAEEKERARAKAVKKQKEIYDTVVDLRIRLEPLIAIARQFPSLEQRDKQPKWRNEEVADVLGQAESALQSLCGEVDSAWRTSWSAEDDSVSDSQFAQWRDSILDRWGEKVNEAAGIVPKGGFKSFDATVSAQMKASLATGKHLQRTRRVKESFPLIGCEVEMEQGPNDFHFDDGDFYRTLLREIIESGDGPGGGLRYAQLSKSGKVKKKRDRSFAKGRRLKYDVHEKLVGFLEPVPMPDPGPLDEILAALFGKRGTVKAAP